MTTEAPRPGRDPENDVEKFLAATAAGWDYETDPPPEEDHGMPPEVDPTLGHNGVPAPEPGDPDYTEVGS